MARLAAGRRQQPLTRLVLPALALLVSALLAAPGARCAPRECRAVVLAAAAAARADVRTLDLVAIALSETGAHDVRAPERGGHCSVGPWQLLVRGCNPVRVAYLRRVGLPGQARLAAELLARRRDLAPPPGKCPFWRYNALSKTWCGKVAAARLALRPHPETS